MRANERRLECYRAVLEDWAAAWPDVQREIQGLPLASAHEIVVARADGLLPFLPRSPAS